MIDRKTIDQVYLATDIVEVVSDFVTLRKSGSSYKGLCPFHEEKTPSFMVSPAKGVCHCFGCHKGGNAINFLMQLNNMSYPEAIRWLAKKYNIEIIETEVDEKKQQERNHLNELYSLNQWANDYFQSTLHETDEGKGIGMTYFRKRQFREDIIKKFQLGFCPSSGYGLADSARKNHLSEDNLVETGLCIRTNSGRLRDRFYGRVIFPIHNHMGKVVGFGGRVLEKKDNVGKYVNSIESPVYNKRHELYGIYFAKQAIQRLDCCYMVEGYTDVISMHQCGIENVVASSGTALTHEQIRLMKKFTTNMTVLYDGDSAGIKASLRGIDMLLEHDFNIKVLLLPDGDDPDSFSHKHTAEEYVEYINSHQVDFIKFKTNLLLEAAGNDIQARSKVINDIADSISRIDNSITRSLYIQECAAITNVREQDIVDTVNSLRNKNKLAKIQEAQHNSMHTSNPDTGTPTQPVGQTSTPNAPNNFQPHSATKLAEENIIKFIIRYGEANMGDFTTEDGQTQSLCFAEYINLCMLHDEITFSNPLFHTILQEVIANKNLPNFSANSYLLSHPDDNVRNYVIRLSNSTEHSATVNDTSVTNELSKNGNKLLIDLHLAILEDKIKETDSLIKSGTLSDEEMMQKIQEYQTFKQTQIAIRNTPIE